MVKKLTKMADKKKRPPAGLFDSALAGTVKESAQQIWLAGLGAFAKAQEEGSKVFEALVKEGASHAAQDAGRRRGKDLGEATSRMANMADRHVRPRRRASGTSWRTSSRTACQGAEQAGRAFGQGHRRADRPHRRTQSQRLQAERRKAGAAAPPALGRRRRRHRQAFCQARGRTQNRFVDLSRRGATARVGLALAGGGSLGAVHEIEHCAPGGGPAALDFTRLDGYGRRGPPWSRRGAGR